MRPDALNLRLRCGILTCRPIDYAFRPRLRVRLTLGGFTFPRKTLGFSATGILTRFIVTRSGMITCRTPVVVVRPPSQVNATLSYRSLATTRCFGTVLSPVHYRRRTPRPVSYYALFKWWLLLSQHPGCHRNPNSFRTEHGLGTLAGGLGCSPLDDESLSPAV